MPNSFVILVALIHWKEIFGVHLVGILGLFHFLQRIIKTLRPNHIDYWDASTQFYNRVPIIRSLIRFIQRRVSAH